MNTRSPNEDVVVQLVPTNQLTRPECVVCGDRTEEEHAALHDEFAAWLRALERIVWPFLHWVVDQPSDVIAAFGSSLSRIALETRQAEIGAAEEPPAP
jgi:hypothetical protein